MKYFKVTYPEPHNITMTLSAEDFTDKQIDKIIIRIYRTIGGTINTKTKKPNHPHLWPTIEYIKQ